KSPTLSRIGDSFLKKGFLDNLFYKCVNSNENNPIMKTTILTALLIVYSYFSFAQAHNVSAGYQPPNDPLVVENLEAWQDLKFGLFMHWGTYSQWGIVESWSLCPEDEGWTQRRAEH